MANTARKLKRAYTVLAKVRKLEEELTQAYIELQAEINEANTLLGSGKEIKIIKPTKVNRASIKYAEQLKQSIRLYRSQRSKLQIENVINKNISTIGATNAPKRYNIKSGENYWSKLSKSQQEWIKDLYKQAGIEFGAKRLDDKAVSVNNIAARILKGQSLEGIKRTFLASIADTATQGDINSAVQDVRLGAERQSVDEEFSVGNICQWLQSLVNHMDRQKFHNDIHMSIIYAFKNGQLSLQEMVDLLSEYGYNDANEYDVEVGV